METVKEQTLTVFFYSTLNLSLFDILSSYFYLKKEDRLFSDCLTNPSYTLTDKMGNQL
jgi:hypothetical protein